MRHISALEMTKASPFDLILIIVEMVTIGTQDGEYKFYRFHVLRHLGGIVQDNMVGCPFLCAYRWSFGRNESFGRFWELYSVDDVVERLTPIERRKKIPLFRMDGGKSKCSKYSIDVLKQLISARVDTYLTVIGDLFETEGTKRPIAPFEEINVHTQIEKVPGKEPVYCPKILAIWVGNPKRNQQMEELV